MLYYLRSRKVSVSLEAIKLLPQIMQNSSDICQAIELVDEQAVKQQGKFPMCLSCYKGFFAPHYYSRLESSLVGLANLQMRSATLQLGYALPSTVLQS